ncbi:MAG: hypothetical protein WCA85_07545 [Paraburkholderia sp.]|uniref:hypothetical protein n=1 Tax=Paraburkholderia sp. TaxID=1926495 RepID=UPI003C5229BD
MHHHIFDSELVHLERVLARASREPFPSNYWRERVAHLNEYPQAPLYRHRISRLAQLAADLDG